ncbi:MAG: DUF2637 domain-containing protein [Mycobacterium sp.]|uniref:DUF2637 domain-containing protein n=1 Tax=Mycobacterium sp. TaxID=1785 RepID=UPI003C31A186
MGNVVHAILPYIPRVVIQIGAAAVSPIALLAAVHGFALTVRAGASRRVYCWAVSAVAAIGVGAFAVSFLALRDLMRVIGYSPATGSIFPALIDTAVAVSTMMLVALGDKPARRARMVKTSAGAKISPVRGLGQAVVHSAKADVRTPATAGGQVRTSESVQPAPAQTVQDAAQTEAAQIDADLASELIASGVTTQPLKT